MSLEVHDLHANHPHGPPVVHGVNLVAKSGRITALLGPNGAGKSTLLKAILGLVPHTGDVSLDGVDLGVLSARERARRVAYVPQRTQLLARMSVFDVVALGRFPHRGGLAPLSAEDRGVIEQALRDTDALALVDRPFPELSGGEQQRVLLARALATGAGCLLLDEPTAALDVHHMLVLHATLRALADRGHCVVVVLHQLSEIRRYTDDAVLLSEGRIHCFGPVSTVVAPEPVQAVYGVELLLGEGLDFRLPEGGS